MGTIIKKHAFSSHGHLNLLILMSLNVVSCAILAGLTAWSATNFFVNLIIKENPCDLLLRTEFCSKIRATYLFAFCLVSTSHAGILIERMWATVFVKSYEKQGTILGAVLAFAAIATSAVSIYFVTMDEDANELITTCLTFSASKSVGNQIYTMFYVQLVLDAIVSVVHYGLYNYNKSIKPGSSGSLSEQFQRNENVKTLKQVTPLLILSNITIGVYIFVISVFRLYKNYLPPNWYEIIAALLFMMPHMPLMFSSLLLIELHKNKKDLNAKHEKLMANQNIPKTDQFQLSIGNWEAEYEARYNTGATASGNPSLHLWSLAKLKTKLKKKHQSKVAVISE
ncbi:hypothetical protein GCK72_025780 [Caenorhabditis remanei]|uniref:Uncharacterized protein n=2 Tax=Caenorhabditis remanei TaxID=31234 RepID=A0A6A5G3D0_CAERE|nr:hypothetical protein GCK72_025780 [Caenorhabditis remanei]KAF1749313.1 hypothetical protein GCK72_025780 [Caenorhabditis remanei]